MREASLREMDCLLREEDGQDVIEYALVVALIGIGAIVCLNGLSSTYNWLVSLGSWFLNYLI